LRWSWREVGLALAVAVGAQAVAGCGDSATTSGPQVTLRITRDFGHEVLAEERLPLAGHETLARLVRENHDVEFDDVGSIESIDGMRGNFGGNAASQVAWRHYVDGLKIHAVPETLPLFAGDVVHLDLGEATAIQDLKAGVGAFPQPFTGTLLGRRVRVTVDCAKEAGGACGRVRGTLRSLGVDISGSAPRQPPLTARVRRARNLQPGIRQVRVLVGPWRGIEGMMRPTLTSGTPDPSGLFVRFSGGGTRVSALGWDARPAQTYGSGTGVVAATRPTLNGIVWLVTGTDKRGVEHAARALDPAKLKGGFGWVLAGEKAQRVPASP
jgi:hypothetical protein